MTNTKAWIGITALGALAYFGLGTDAAQGLMDYFRITPNSASDLEFIRYMGQAVMTAGGIGAVGSIAGKLTGNPMRKAGIEGMVDTAIAANVVDWNYMKQMLYNLEAYSPGLQSKMDFGAKVAFVAFLGAFAYSFMEKEEKKGNK